MAMHKRIISPASYTDFHCLVRPLAHIWGMFCTLRGSKWMLNMYACRASKQAIVCLLTCLVRGAFPFSALIAVAFQLSRTPDQSEYE